MPPTRRRSRVILSQGEEEGGPFPKTQRLSSESANFSTIPTAGTPEKEHHEEESPVTREPGTGTGSKGKGKKREGESHDDAHDMAEKSRRMEEICRQQEEEERQLGVRGHDVSPMGKENEGVLPRSSGHTNKSGALSPKKEKKSEAGIVLRIYIHNFMCHKKLDVRLCRNVNFISGRNGSGKSAILAALQICLGANANSTHRARKLSDFIRHGWKGEATLDVTLLNTVDGFKFSEYGQSITVRRTIKQPNGGGFELIAHNGEVKSKAKDELNKMLDVLNIQVDNPCAVLDQENSKKFLQGSERDKYAFFMKATDLDRILADSEITGREISKMKLGHHQAVEQLPRYQSIVTQLRQELREYESLEDLERKIGALKEKMAWKFVEEAENEVEELDQNLKIKGLEINSFKGKIYKFEEKLRELTDRKEEVKAGLDEEVAEASRLKEEVVKADTELAAAQEPLYSLRDQRASLQREERAKQEKKLKAEKKLQEAKEKARRNASDEKEKRLLDQMHHVEQGLAQNKRHKKESMSEEALLGLRHELKTATEAAERSKQDLHQQQQELAARQSDLHSLSSERFNPLTALGSYMPALVKFLAGHVSEFQNRPVGPIGAHVQLKEECKNFRVCIEAHIMKALNNFVVTSQRDKTTLMRLMKAFRAEVSRGGGRPMPIPTIIVQPPGRRYNPPENPTGFLQIMQAINVTNDLAFNALVDQTSIEKICLFPDKRTAEEACLVGSSGQYQRMPHGMYEAYYSSLGGRSCSKLSVVDGNIQTRMNLVNPDRHRRILGIDEGTQRQEAEALVEAAKAEVERLRALANEAVRTCRKAQETSDEAGRGRTDLLRQEKELMRRKQKLEAELLAVQSTKDDNNPTVHLERCLEEASDELESVMKELATLEGHVREVTAQIDPLKQARASAKAAHSEATRKCKDLSEKFEDGGSAVMTHQHKIARGRARLAKVKVEDERGDLEKKKEESETKRKAVLEKTETFMKNMKAKQGLEWDGSRATSSMTLDRLREKAVVMADRLKEEREKRQLRGKSKGEVESQLAQAVKVFKEKDQLAKQLAENMKILARERKDRTEKWTMLRNYMAQMTSVYFNRHLQEKGASGEVLFNYANHTLGLTYQKDGSNGSNQCTDVKLLSGGERSFSTLALLLALGTGHECPFRVMDEFDVFMDAQSRNIAIKQVMTFAKNDSSRQFILITPQDLNSVTASDTVKIIKMRPPRKGDHNQTTLEEAFAAGSSS